MRCHDSSSVATSSSSDLSSDVLSDVLNKTETIHCTMAAGFIQYIGSALLTVSARNKDQKLVGSFLITFYRLLHCCPIGSVWKIWLIEMDLGQLNTEIGCKMPNGQLHL